MRYAEFIGMIARLSASGDKFDPDGEECPNGFEHDTGDSLDALDELIHKARAMAKWQDVPKRNFVEGQWSFRISHNVDDKHQSFSFHPKGDRGHWSRRGDMTLASDGTTWMFCVYVKGTGRSDARATFAEAKACVLKLLNAKEA